MKNSRILVTGGAGAIGINLLNRLLKEEIKEIIVLDNLSSGKIDFLPEDQRIIFYHVDIFRNDELKTIFEKYDFDYIFHLAAHFANQNSVDHPLSDIQTNIIGTMNLLEFCKTQNTLKKFVYASSSCVYGNSEIMNEDDFIYPHETPYAINKYTAEIYTKYYAHLFKIPAISIRIFNTYGPYELAGKYRNVIPKFIENAILGEDIIITGDGNETRDFTYCDDTIDLLIKASLSAERNGDYFNGGTGKETKIIDLAKLIIKLSDSNSKIVITPRRNWDLVTSRMSNIEKSERILLYKPKINLEEGLYKYIQWYICYLKLTADQKKNICVE